MPTAADETPTPFGEHAANRFGADVTYRGRVGKHDYVVRVRHRLLDTSFTLSIDGVEHDPKAEQKRDKKKQADDESPAAPVETEELAEAEEPAAESSAAPTEPEEPAGADQPSDPDAPSDGLHFRLDERFTSAYCTVQRPRGGGDLKDAELITVRTAGLGGAGEVEVRSGFQELPLAPDKGSPSAAREQKRTSHPTRYALLAALKASARYLLPLLGLGALFSGILEPVIEWVIALVRPLFDAIWRLVQPPLEWLGELTRPVREFIATITQPIKDFIAWVLQPVRDFFAWLRGLLRFDLSLPFDIPDWVFDVAVPTLVVIVVFIATFQGLRRRNQRLEAARASAAAAPEGGGTRKGQADETDEADEADENDQRGEDGQSGPVDRGQQLQQTDR